MERQNSAGYALQPHTSPARRVKRRLAVGLAIAAGLIMSGCDEPAENTNAGEAPAPVERDYSVEPSINPELAEHTRHFEPKVYKIGENVYSAVGWALANTIMIEGDDGILIFDASTAVEPGEKIMAEFRKITDKPVVAVVYSHFHPDHWGGVKAFVDEQDVIDGKVQIIAHETLVGNVVRQGGTVGTIQAMRSGYTFGVFLRPEDLKYMNGGIGPHVGGGNATFIQPTLTFDKELDVTIAGIDMHFVHVPSEAPDEIALYLPDSNILLSAETIQGPTLPNIHTLRGTRFRDPVQWYRSIDVLRAFEADNMVPSHGQPVYGAEKVEEVLTMTRDGMQYVHDQTIRMMNKGLPPDELAEAISFPPHLRDYAPYLREYYGTIKHGVRQIYTGYLGWFGGDPVDLDPVPPVERARRHVGLMGGRDAVLAAAGKAYDEGEYQWAAELATYLVRIDHEDQEARKVKAASFRHLGYDQININWRNWYLTSAMELEGDIDPLPSLRVLAQVFSSDDVVSEWPADFLVNGLTTRLKAEETLDMHMTGGFRFTDVGEDYGLEIRRGIAQVHDAIPEDAAFTLSFSRATLIAIGQGRLKLKDALESGEASLEGDPAALQAFLSKFDSPAQEIWLTVR
ncbi:MAG: alkyl sulfatase dimerization domain-containing protein [Parvibaculaceae bacterium]